jgi:hypothetical protein
MRMALGILATHIENILLLLNEPGCEERLVKPIKNKIATRLAIEIGVLYLTQH